MKTCPKCEKELPSDDFNKGSTSADGLYHCCKKCEKESRAKWRDDNRVRNQTSDPRLKTLFKKCSDCGEGKSSVEFFVNSGRADGLAQCCRECKADQQVCRTYGLLRGQYRSILIAQGLHCALCEATPTNNGRLHVDHRHVDDFAKLSPEEKRLQVRGLLCIKCNHLLGNLEICMGIVALAAACEVGVPEWTARALNYLKRHSDGPGSE